MAAVRSFVSGAAHPAQAAVETHRDDIEHRGGEIPVNAAALRHIADHAAHLFIGLAVKLYGAGGAGNELERGLDQGTLAGAIGADDRHEDALGHMQVDVPDGRFAVVGHGEVVDLEGD